MKISNCGKVSELLKDVKIPRMFHAGQSFDNKCIAAVDIEDKVFSELSKPAFDSLIKPGMQIAITAGSRGIRNVEIITKAIVDYVKKKQGIPFIVPAMGSHGGATAEGQKEILAGFKITEESMGCEIRSSMDVVQIGLSDLRKPVYLDRNAYNADGIIISCRLKPHNAFRGEYESGPCKMMTVGLGKQSGAEAIHSDGMGLIEKNIISNAKIIIQEAPLLFALPCLENAYDETSHIEAILPEDIIKREPELLQIAKAQMPRILAGEGDVLVVDEIGKNFSGTGVDPNITGTFSTPFATGGVKVQRTCMLRLSEVSHGNGLGIGLSDAITARIFNDLDFEKMYPNCITSTVLASARIPTVVATEKEAVQICIRTCTGVNHERIRLIRIPNSLHIGRIMLSEVYYEDVVRGKYPGLSAIDSPEELIFNSDGELVTQI